ncbi:MAG TPA: oligosaccharide flippase family protein [Chloroflexota bacterium]|nr:oligosaccharide flippase family protein [Chloroflexota bacterium]
MADQSLSVFWRNLLASWSTRVVSLGVTFLVTPILVAHLGSQAYGLWAIGLTLVSYLSLVDGGVNGGLVKVVSVARARDEGDRVSGYLMTALVFYALLGILIVVIVALIRAPLGRLLGVPPDLAAQASWLFLGVAGLLMINNLTGVIGALFNGLEAVHLGGILSLVAVILTATGQLIVLVPLKGGLESLVAITLAAAALTLVGAVIWLRHTYHGLEFSIAGVRWSRFKEITSLSLGIQVSNVAGVVNATADKFVIAGLLGLISAGLYDLGSRLCVLIWTLSWLVAAAAFPTSARLGVTSPELFQAFYRRAERYLLITALGLGGLLFVLAPWLVPAWLGPGYEQVVLVTRLLAVAGVGLNLTNVASVALWSRGRTREVTFFSCWRLGMHLALSLLLTWRYGLLGTLAGAVAGLVIPSTWLMLWAHRHFEVRTPVWLKEDALAPFVSMLGAGGLTYAVLRLAAPILGAESGRVLAWAAVLLGAGLFGSSYVISLVLLRGFDDQELTAARLRLGRVWSYAPSLVHNIH